MKILHTTKRKSTSTRLIIYKSCSPIHEMCNTTQIGNNKDKFFKIKKKYASNCKLTLNDEKFNCKTEYLH